MRGLRVHAGVSVVATRVGVLLRSDVATFQVTGADARAFFERLVPLLDGTRDRAEVVAALGDRSAASVGAVLDGLLAKGIVEEEGSAGEARGAGGGLAGKRVIVVGRARWGRVAARELAAAGLTLVEGVSEVDRRRSAAGEKVVSEVDRAEAVFAADPPHLLVAAVAPEDASTMDRLARAAHRTRVPSLWAQEAGGSLLLGPLVVPGETACRVCAADESLNPIMARGARAQRTREAAYALLGQLVAMEAVKLLGGQFASRLGGRVLVEELAKWTSSLHMLVRLPWCRVCGEAERSSVAASALSR